VVGKVIRALRGRRPALLGGDGLLRLVALAGVELALVILADAGDGRALVGVAVLPPPVAAVLASTQGQTDANADQPQHGLLVHRTYPFPSERRFPRFPGAALVRNGVARGIPAAVAAVKRSCSRHGPAARRLRTPVPSATVTVPEIGGGSSTAEQPAHNGLSTGSNPVRPTPVRPHFQRLS